ncbi:hypothetical protein PHLCEN_2v5750 [Hermanssonia centrifuga]|uniref:Uncharacterized protein n=1 Tax=Hermanssonia centrifuga TaxID=98765 RepID=A0A2R6P1J7_9APHY|nr:hypothetical protein PHLCEN_2v5750 [Hermanssonia centrifuga]
MVNTEPVGRRHAKKTKEVRAAARAASKEKENAYWKEVETLRKHNTTEISRVARQFEKTEKNVRLQLYRGGQLLVSKRKPSLRNAVLKDLAKQQKENGVSSDGRNTIINLSKSVSVEEIQALPEEEKERMMRALIEQRSETPAITKVNEVLVGRDIEHTMSRIEPEMEALSQRTGCHFMVLVLNSSVTDSWETRVFPSAEVKDALLNMFKLTPEDLALRLQAYLTTGIMDEVLREERKLAEKDLPKSMKWAYYEDLCCEFGVELVGWTEPGELCNPADMKTPALQRVLNSINSGQCFWRALSEDEWSSKRAARSEVLANEGGLRRKGRNGKKPAKSREIIDEEDEPVESAGAGEATMVGTERQEPAAHVERQEVERQSEAVLAFATINQ